MMKSVVVVVVVMMMIIASSSVTAVVPASPAAELQQQHQQQQPMFRVRHRRQRQSSNGNGNGNGKNNSNSNSRSLQQEDQQQDGQFDIDTMMNVIPTLSQDDGMVDTELPPLTLQLIGTNGTQLSLQSLFQIEFTMSDYLTELLQDRWPDTSTSNIDIGGNGNGGNSGNSGNGISYNNNGEIIKPIPALNRVRTIVVSDAPMYEGEDEDGTAANAADAANGGGGGRGRGRHLEFTQNTHRLDRNNRNNRPFKNHHQYRHLRMLQQQQQGAEDGSTGSSTVIGNTLQLVATLSFVDQSPPVAEMSSNGTTGGGGGGDAAAAAAAAAGGGGDDNNNSLRQSESNTATTTAAADTDAVAALFSLPDEASLEIAAGDAWNDLNFYFGNYLYPSVTINSDDPAVQEEFLNLRGVASGNLYPTSAPADVGDVAAPPASPPDEEEQEQEQDPVEEPSTATAENPTEPVGGSVTLTGSGGSDSDSDRGNVIASINDETYASQSTGDSGVDPLYPAIAAGVACFLCTIIVLGYRRQARHSELIGNKSDLNLDDGEEPPIHVHNSTFLDDGEEEIEVEDEHIKRERSMVGIQCGPSRRNRNSSNLDPDYDQFSSGDDYGSSSQRDSNYNFNYDYDLNGIDDGGAAAGSRSMRQMYGGSSLIDDTQSEQSSAGYDGSSSRNNYVPQQYQQSASTRNSEEADELDVYASLSPEEKKIFLRYINQGYPVQQAKDMILSDRGQAPPRSRRQHPSSRSPEDKIQSEMMPDGHTMIHIPSNLDGAARGGGSRSIGHDGQIMSHGKNSNRRQQHGSRSMRVMMTESASSIGSNSFDDRDYLRNATSGSFNGPVADPIMEHGSGGRSNNRFSFNRSSESSSRRQQRPARGQVADPNVMTLPDY